MAEAPKPNEAIRRPTRWMRALNVIAPALFRNKDDVPVKDTIARPQIGMFNEHELRNMPGVIKEGTDRVQRPSQIDEVLSVFSATAGDNRRQIAEIGKLKSVTPELDQCKKIYVSSIMSPNDLQTDAIEVTSNSELVSEEVNTQISEVLNTFFNDRDEFGVKLSRWIGDCLFETGSVPVLVMPKVNIALLNKIVEQKRIGGFRAGTAFASESLNNLATESLLSDEASKTKIIHESVVALESVIPEMASVKFDQKAKISGAVVDSIRKLLEKGERHIKFHSNPSIVGNQTRELQERADVITKTIDAMFLDDRKNSISLVDVPAKTEGSEPVVVELPAECVVPVIVPGSPSTHIGYFVLVDEFGTPVNSVMSNQVGGMGEAQLNEQRMVATFGKGSFQVLGSNADNNQQRNVATTVFGVTMRHILERKLQHMDMDGATVDNYQAIGNLMFQQLIMDSEIHLVFVPEPMMVYYRFDHRPDGTGKTMVENVALLLSLRTTLVIARIMAEMRNAVDHKTVEIQVDEKNANIEQTLEIVREAYTHKRMYKFDSDPFSIARDIINKSLTIIPRGMKGLPENLEVSTDSKSAGAITPEADLIETLTQWITTGLGIPHAVLNQLGENEYSRTVATQNLFFSNQMRDKQRVVKKFNDKYVRNYIKYSESITKTILGILEHDGVKAKGSQEEITDQSVESDDKDTRVIFGDIMANISADLPTPNIMPTKARYEEMQAYVTFIETLAEKAYPETMLSVDDQELKTAMKAVKDGIQSQMIREFVSTLGYQGQVTLPELESFDVQKLHDLVVQMANVRSGGASALAVTKTPAPASAEDAGGAGGGATPGW